MINKLALVFLSIQFNLAYADTEDLPGLLAKIKKTSESLSFQNTVKLKINEKVDTYNQQVIVGECSVSVSISFNNIKLFSSQYEISHQRAISHGEFFGSNGIYFGFRSLAFGSVPVLFDTKAERETYAKKLRALRTLCVTDIIKDYIEKTGQKYKPTRRILYDGKIPLTANNFGQADKSAGLVFRNNAIASLQGEESLFHRIIAIGEAKKSIRMQALDFRADSVGRLIAEELIKKRAAGLDVRVLVDGMANLFKGYFENEEDNGQILYNNMMAAGIRVFGFSCGGYSVKNETRKLDIFKLLRRNHEKMLIIDESLAFVGGPNTSFQYHRMGGFHESSWRDFDLFVKGDVISDIVYNFESNFRDKQIRFQTYSADKECFNPYDPTRAKADYEKFRKEKTLPFKLVKNFKQLIEMDNITRNLEKLRAGLKLNFSPNSSTDDRTYIPLTPIVFNRVNAARFILNRPEYQEDQIYEAYLDLIARAQKEILLTNQFFIPDEQMLKALTDAIDRGVSVKVLTNGLVTNKELIMATLAGRYYYRDLYYNDVAKKIRGDFSVFEWDGIRKGDRRTLMGRLHAKYMVVDREILLIGSYNFDNSSRKNSESVIIVDSSEVAKNFVDWFFSDLNLSNKITEREMIEFKSFKPGNSAFFYWLSLKIIEHL